MNEARQPAAPHPNLKAMLVCDRALRDPQTKKLSLLGIFDRIGIPDLPANYASGMTIYARLTDAQGWYRFRLELVRLDDDHAIGRGEMEATLEHRLRMSEITLNLQNVRFERPGTYEFRLFANNKYLGGLTLTVERAVRSDTVLTDEPGGWSWTSPLQNG